MTPAEQLAADKIPYVDENHYGDIETNMAIDKRRRDFIAGYEAAEPKWVSVCERLPDKDETVLVKLKEPNVINWSYMVANCMKWDVPETSHLHGQRVWYGPNDTMANRKLEVTHWLPITPPTPTEGQSHE